MRISGWGGLERGPLGRGKAGPQIALVGRGGGQQLSIEQHPPIEPVAVYRAFVAVHVVKIAYKPPLLFERAGIFVAVNV